MSLADRAALLASLQNAATRDETVRALRQQYFVMMEAVLRVTPARGQSSGTYDPLPLYRYHDEAAAQLSRLAMVADALAERLRQLAAAWQFPLAEGASPKLRREARLLALLQWAECAAQDARRRWAHGQVWAHAKDDSGAEEALRAPVAALRQQGEDMGMFVKSMACSKVFLRDPH